ncbi:MAG: ROK family protein [Granulosicoccus sp.]
MLKETGDLVVLDNGGTHVRIGHIRHGQLHAGLETYSSQLLCVPDARDVLLSLILQHIRTYELHVKAAVLGIPGILDRVNDRISHCNNIPELEGAGLRQFLADALDCEVLFEQDIMLQLLGEWQAGAGQGCSSLFGVYFGTGIGAACLLNGNPFDSRVQDIQAGHIPIMAEGRLCKCGNTNCIEAYACGHVLIDLARKADCPVEELFERQRQNRLDMIIATELDKFVIYQAYMLATVSTLFTPRRLVIGGGVPMMPGYPRDKLLRTVRKHLQKPYPAESIQFAFASLANDAPLYGALALLRKSQNHILNRQ